MTQNDSQSVMLEHLFQSNREWAAAMVAKEALASDRTIREQVLEMGFVERGELTLDQLDQALDVRRMTRP